MYSRPDVQSTNKINFCISKRNFKIPNSYNYNIAPSRGGERTLNLSWRSDDKLKRKPTSATKKESHDRNLRDVPYWIIVVATNSSACLARRKNSLRRGASKISSGFYQQDWWDTMGRSAVTFAKVTERHFSDSGETQTRRINLINREILSPSRQVGHA